MSQPIYRVRASDTAESGLKPTPHPMDKVLWADGQNVVFYEGGPQKTHGSVALINVSAEDSSPIRGMAAVETDDGVSRLFFGDKANLWHWNSVSVEKLEDNFTGVENETSNQPASSWSIPNFGNLVYFTNGVDLIQRWTEGGGLAPMASPPVTWAEIGIKKAQHMLWLNTSLSAFGYIWSNEDDPDGYDFLDPAEAAGNNVIRELDSPIKAACLFSDRIAVVSRSQLHFIRYVGAPFYFGHTFSGLSGIGAVGKMALVEANRYLYGYDHMGAWQSDGVQFKRIDSPDIREWIMEQIDEDQLSKVVLTHNSQLREVRFWFPGVSGENSFGCGYRYDNNSWTKYTKGRTAAVQQPGVFKYHIEAEAGKVLFQSSNTGVDEAGVAVDAWVQTKPMDMDIPHMWKYVDLVLTQVRRLTGTLQVEVGAQENLDDAISWSTPDTIDDGFEPAYVRESGRYISIRWRSTALGADWAISGFDVLGEASGAIV